MKVHGIVCSYLGDNEVDVGKTANWLNNFVNTLFFYDTNYGDAARKYAVDYSKSFPDAQYAYHSATMPGFFTDAGVFRQAAFQAALKAWRYAPGDWVVFIDANESLSSALGHDELQQDTEWPTLLSVLLNEARAGTDALALPFFVFLAQGAVTEEIMAADAKLGNELASSIPLLENAISVETDPIKKAQQQVTLAKNLMLQAANDSVLYWTCDPHYQATTRRLDRMFRVGYATPQPLTFWRTLDSFAATTAPVTSTATIISYGYARFGEGLPPWIEDTDLGWANRKMMQTVRSVGLNDTTYATPDPVGTAHPVGTQTPAYCYWVNKFNTGASDPPQYLIVEKGTATSPQPADDPSGQFAVVAAPSAAATYWRQSGANIEVGKNTAGTAYPDPLTSMDYTKTKRAQLTFPGIPGNYMTTPNLWTTGGVGQTVEWFVRLQANWPVPQTIDYGGLIFLSNRLGVRRILTGNAIQFYAYGNDGVITNASGAVPAGWTNGQIVWLHGTHNGTTMTLEWAADSPTIPTTWTQLRAPLAVTGTGGLQAANAVATFGTDGTTGSARMFFGRLLQIIVRNTIGGANVLNISENNAGSMTDPRHFNATTGQVVTLIQTNKFVFPGVAGNYLSVPNAAPLQITGDIELVARINPTTWNPSAPGVIISKWATTGNQRGYQLSLGPNGVLIFDRSLTGTNTQTVTSTPVGGVGGARWVKVVCVAATGATDFYTALDSTVEPTTWGSRVGFTGTALAGTATATTAPVTVGGYPAGGSTAPFNGRIHQAIIRNGIAGTVVLDVAEYFSNVAGQTSFAATGGTVTANQTAGNTVIQADPVVTIVQPQADVMAWRFDVNEYPGAGTSYTDPRGRVWTLTSDTTITKDTTSFNKYVALWRLNPRDGVWYINYTLGPPPVDPLTGDPVIDPAVWDSQSVATTGPTGTGRP